MPKPPVTPQDRDQVAAYIYQMCSGLAEMAKARDLRFLAYLLEMTALAAATGAGERAKVRLDARHGRSRAK